jgi:aryl carrier-like protein
MLQALQEKTKGNLDDKEENMLTQALDQLRMAYVKLSENAK